jgi:hypothetical protein
MGVSEIVHASSKILRGSLFRHLHMTPGFRRIEKYEQTGSAVTGYSQL